jgi:hypothetical protein
MYIEPLDVVRNINDDIQACVEDSNDFYIDLSYSSNSYNKIITYMDQVIWSSENDDREFDESKNEYKPLEPLIRKKINEINKMFSNLVL